jgi:hypothetical protein
MKTETNPFATEVRRERKMNKSKNQKLDGRNWKRFFFSTLAFFLCVSVSPW